LDTSQLDVRCSFRVSWLHAGSHLLLDQQLKVGAHFRVNLPLILVSAHDIAQQTDRPVKPG
jgi:hypothetical protein